MTPPTVVSHPIHGCGIISSVWVKDQMVAFFEYPKEDDIQYVDRDHLGGMQHVAFHVRPEQFDDMCDHVKSCDIKVMGPMVIGKYTKAFYFFDNNGIRLEINTYRDDARDRAMSARR